MPPRSSVRSQFQRVFGVPLISATVLALIVGAVTGAEAAFAALSSPASSTGIWVDPVTGSDKAAGTADAPLATIQAALDRVRAGNTIHLDPGVYVKGGVTRVDGTASAPITIEGPSDDENPATDGTPADTATVYGTGHVLAIENSHYVLEGFTVDGQRAAEQALPLQEWPRVGASADEVASFKDNLKNVVTNSRPIYIDGFGSRVTGTQLYRMVVSGSGGECVRVRDYSEQTTITQSLIRYCGMYPGSGTSTFEYHNGEGIYVGTSPKSNDLKNYADDQTTATVASDDLIETFGSECFDVKENASNNSLLNSTCEENFEPLGFGGSNLELRGFDNTISGNVIRYSAGYGLKLASDEPAEDLGGNNIVNNIFADDAAAAVYDSSSATQGTVCGNRMADAGDSQESRWTGTCTAPVTGSPTSAQSESDSSPQPTAAPSAPASVPTVVNSSPAPSTEPAPGSSIASVPSRTAPPARWFAQARATARATVRVVVRPQHPKWVGSAVATATVSARASATASSRRAARTEARRLARIRAQREAAWLARHRAHRKARERARRAPVR